MTRTLSQNPNMQYNADMIPTLNWQEIAKLAGLIDSQVRGLFIDRIVVPERPTFPGGYIKGEWAIRATGRRNEMTLLCSVRARSPYLLLIEGKGPKAAKEGTHSAFDLSMSKHLKGAKILSVEALPQERIIIIWLSGEKPADQLGLALCMIPAAPEALLVKKGSDTWPILARSRNLKKPEIAYHPPDGSKAPANPGIRPELISDLETYRKKIEVALSEEAAEFRIKEAEKLAREQLKQAKERLRQSTTALKEGRSEADWRKLGDLLKSNQGQNPPLIREKQKAFREALDFVTGEKVQIPCDPKLSLKDQVEKFYQMEKRKKRRISEAELRTRHFQTAIEKIESALSHLPQKTDWKEIEKFERLIAETTGTPLKPASGMSEKKKSSSGGWSGKTAFSKDGWPIFIGRSKDENLLLTFKQARGNDLWVHVRGRPGAHIVIPVQPGKSVPLETLLDAATLTVYYSGGENWGKTEVDYTFKKHVKRIKDSTEASYTHNKTLIIEIEPSRLKRLLGT